MLDASLGMADQRRAAAASWASTPARRSRGLGRTASPASRWTPRPRARCWWRSCASRAPPRARPPSCARSSRSRRCSSASPRRSPTPCRATRTRTSTSSPSACAGMVHVRSEPTGEAVPGAHDGRGRRAHRRLQRARRSLRRGADQLPEPTSSACAPPTATAPPSSPPSATSCAARSTPSSGFADILMTEVDGPLTAEAREEVEQIRGSGKHLLDLINDILEFSALESGQLKLTRSRVDLAAVAWEVVREAAGIVGARPVLVRIEGEPHVFAARRPASASARCSPTSSATPSSSPSAARSWSTWARDGRCARVQRARHRAGHQPAGARRHLRGVQADQGRARAPARHRAGAGHRPPPGAHARGEDRRRERGRAGLHVRGAAAGVGTSRRTQKPGRRP